MTTNSIQSIMDLLKSIESMRESIDSKILFDQDGWPIFESKHFLTEWPENVVTFKNKTSTLLGDKSKTLLCFFASDAEIYTRFSKIHQDIPLYREYAGIVFPDITVTWDMDIEMQEAVLLANHMFAAVLASEGIHLAFNTRCGSLGTRKSFRNIPRNVTCASGFLGCSNSTDMFSASAYINKILGLMPDKLIIYGKHDRLIDQQMDALGINYRYYADFHTMSKRRTA